jgi:cytoskeletal protein RodZ
VTLTKRIDDMNRFDSHEHEEAAEQLRRRMERDERQRATARRTAGVVAAAAVVGALLLTIGLAAVSRASAREPIQSLSAPQLSAPVKTPAPEVASQAAVPKVAAEPKPAPRKAAASSPKAAVLRSTKAPTVAPAPKHPTAASAPAPQHLTIKIGASGYEPSTLTASSKSPIKITVGKGEGCAAGFVIPTLGINMDNSRGAVTLSVGRLKPGRYVYHCSMDMVQGTLVVR